MDEYKRKHVGMRSLRAESHPGMVVKGSVDNIGKIQIEFGNSMTLRMNYSDAIEVMNLLEDCASRIKEEGLEHKCDIPVCDTEKALRENTLKARRSAMSAPSMGVPENSEKKLSEMQGVDPFDPGRELGNDPRKW